MKRRVSRGHASRSKVMYVVVVVVVLLLLLSAWWLDIDREPGSAEMRLAFIKHYETSNPARAPKDQLEDRQRLIEFELKKQHCEKIGTKCYRCAAALSINGQPVGDPGGAEEAVYTHDAKGWLFAPVDAGEKGKTARAIAN